VPTNLTFDVLGVVVTKMYNILAMNIDVKAVWLLTSEHISASIAEI
jgi:hypothetical protein